MEPSMKRGVLLALGIVLAPLAAARAGGPWDGTYLYEQSLGKALSGMALFVTHTLTINSTDCRIDAEGVQTTSISVARRRQTATSSTSPS
jgi:hypothetical protein